MFTNSTMLNPIFWMILGASNVFFFFGLRYYFQDWNLKISKLKWAVIVCYWIVLNFVIAAGFTLIGENEVKAGLRFMAFFAPFLIIGAAIIVRWILLGKKQKSRND